jgi:hypothetical protein
MDAKTAIEILQSNIIDYAPTTMGCKPISIKRCEQIADFVEQQEKYAELGRLAEKSLKESECGGKYQTFWRCDDCTASLLCKRAELLVIEDKKIIIQHDERGWQPK